MIMYAGPIFLSISQHHGLDTHITSANVATVLAALIAASVAVLGYAWQQRAARRRDRGQVYAEAIRAVEDYSEGPYRILRKDGTVVARREITQHLSDVKSRIAFYNALMETAPPAIASAWKAYADAARTEAGPQMTEAWHKPPMKKDSDVPIGTPLPREATDSARDVLLAAVREDQSTFWTRRAITRKQRSA